MKTKLRKAIIALSMLLIISFAFNLGLGNQIEKCHTKITKLETEKDSINQVIAKYDYNNGIHFIWNDDEESIPKDGQPIKIEFTDQDVIYIGPLNKELPSDKKILKQEGISILDY
jgi:hypothetical protein